MMHSTECIPKMNVSREANAGFMADLKREDRPRYDRLIRNIQIGAARMQRLQNVTEIPQRRCEQCGLTLPSDIRADSRFCDEACKSAAYRLRKAA
jgi:hypothetical protein